MGERIDKLLASQTGYSREFVQEQILLGRVSVNGKKISKVGQRIHPNDRIETDFKEDKPLDLIPIAYPLQIIYEDHDLLAIDKPQGMIVHPASSNSGPTLIHYLLHHFNNNDEFRTTSPTRPGLVHRLDRGTSGVMVIAKHRKALDHLAAQFKARTTRKTYEAIVWGEMKEKGIYRSKMGRDLKERKRMSSRTDKGKEAVTEWQRLQSHPQFTWLRLFPKTGRTHQLRVHLTEDKHPIVADKLYEIRSVTRWKEAVPASLKAEIEKHPFPFLHAKELEIEHPTEHRPLHFKSPLPDHFDTLWKAIQQCK